MTAYARGAVAAMALVLACALLVGCEADRIRTDFVGTRYVQDAEGKLARLPRDAAGARRALNRAIALLPPDSQLRLRVARLYAAARGYAEARALFEAVPEVRLEPEDRALFGYCLLRTGERERGAELCLGVIREAEAMRASGAIARERWALLLNDAGYLLIDAGAEIELAADAVRRVAEAMPLEPAFVDSHGWALARQNRMLDAAFYLERARRQSPRDDPEMLYHLGVVYARLQRFGEAEELLRRARQLDPDLAEVEEELRHLGRILPPLALV